ncbi:hypothetical protein DOTSEDRAFT_73806 [Dothistroma septosporum NZE10]|uniref:Uncharacterized protein n=1 Tax=Dothistroma septosporum (strain NZE10 / CBS 128990) TaxID=675120 RepID=N1PJJ7_DOTSN|nr:hypothetical protein DOTSEDRAFT_73806 [Dothistroma septosporum NZE10]
MALQSNEAAKSSTTGSVFVATGTKDGRPGRYDHTSGSTNVKLAPISITVENVRTLPQPPKTESEGYQLASFQTSLPDDPFLDADTPENRSTIESIYFPECKALVQRVTGAAEAFPYVYRIRNQEKAMTDISKADFHKDSVPIVHVDRDTETARQRLIASLGAGKAEHLLTKYKRYGSMNVWRPVKDAVQKWPLMLVDHQAIQDWDYDTHMFRIHFTNDTRISTRGEKNHETMLMKDERYRYVYAEGMRPDEAWLFYAFHSEPRLGIPHSAFWDDGTCEGARTRWSIEVRIWVFFED